MEASVSSNHNPNAVTPTGGSASIVSILRLSFTAGKCCFLLLLDDNRGSSGQSGLYASQCISIRPNGSMTTLKTTAAAAPRMSCATYSPHTGIVYAAGRTIANLILPDHNTATTNSNLKPFVMEHVLPASVRTGPKALQITSHGKVVVCAVHSTFYAIAIPSPSRNSNNSTPPTTSKPVKLLTVQQSSQVHPILIEKRSQNNGPGWTIITMKMIGQP